MTLRVEDEDDKKSDDEDGGFFDNEDEEEEIEKSIKKLEEFHAKKDIKKSPFVDQDAYNAGEVNGLDDDDEGLGDDPIQDYKVIFIF